MKRLAPILLVAGLTLVVLYWQHANDSALPINTKVVRVIDGDTIVVEGGEHVRLIGIDTPETVHPRKPVERFGREASKYTHDHLQGERVVLGYDQANAHRKHRDRYGRLLAYVKRRRDGLDFNAQIVRDGYAYAETHYPFARMEEFRQYQREAREGSRGLWDLR
jgi:micrococcal nuclease